MHIFTQKDFLNGFTAADANFNVNNTHSHAAEHWRLTSYLLAPYEHLPAAYKLLAGNLRALASSLQAARTCNLELLCLAYQPKIRTVHRNFRDLSPEIAACKRLSSCSRQLGKRLSSCSHALRANSARKRAALPNRHRSTTARLPPARKPLARPRTALDAARARFESTSEPLRLRAVRLPSLKIDTLSKYRIVHVTKLAL